MNCILCIQVRVNSPSCSTWPWVLCAAGCCNYLFCSIHRSVPHLCHTADSSTDRPLMKPCSASSRRGSHTWTDQISLWPVPSCIHFLTSLLDVAALSPVQFEWILSWCLAEEEVWIRLIRWNLVFISHGCGCSSLEISWRHVSVFISETD